MSTGHAAKNVCRTGAFVACVAALLGCGKEPSPPVVDVVWADGEEARYDIRTGDTVVGTRTYSIERTPEGWVQRYESTRRTRVEKGEVRMDAALRPLSSWKEAGGSKTEIEYRPGAAVVRAPPPAGGDPKESTLEVSGVVVDNEAALVVQRGLRVPEGGSTSYTSVVARSGGAAKVTVADAGRRTVQTPAGAIESRCVALAAGGARQTACYATAAPHVLVSYENARAGATFVLRSFRPGKDAPWQGDTTPPPVLQRPAPVGVLHLLAAALVMVPLMLLSPLFLGRLFKRRFGVGWKLWGAGALTFVASQVVHLPLNYALGLLGAPRALGLLPLPLLAVAAGLSAGLCEELARFVAWRFALRRQARSFHEALQFGAGHGGIEAMILGVMAVIQVGAMVLLSIVPPEALGVPPAQVGAVESQLDTFWLSPWYLLAAGGVERVFAITLHVACSVLVVRGVARRQPVWIGLAIALHAGLDAWAVWAMGTFGMAVTEVGIAVTAVGCLALIWALRGPAPAASPTADPQELEDRGTAGRGGGGAAVR